MKFTVGFFWCFTLVALTVSQSEDEGQWIDDVTNNRQVMGEMDEDMAREPVPDAPVMPAVGFTGEDDGEWKDDVTGNMIIMGEDALSQDTGLGGNFGEGESRRRRRHLKSKGRRLFLGRGKSKKF